MKLNVVSSFFVVALTTSLSAMAQQDAAQYYANWVVALPYAKTVTDWAVNFDSIETAGTLIAKGYDKFTAPKFENNAAGYEAERQYYEAVAKSLQPLESWATAGKKLSDWAGYLTNPKGAVAVYAYNTMSPQLWEKTDEALKKAAAAEQQRNPDGVVRPQEVIASSTPAQVDQTVFGSGGTNGVFSSTNNTTQAWGSQNDGSWQCLPSQWNSQNNPVAWPKN